MSASVPVELNRAILADAGVDLERTTSHLDPVNRLRVWVTVDPTHSMQMAYGLCASLPGTPVSVHPGWSLREYDNAGTFQEPSWHLMGLAIYFAPTDLDSLLDRVRAFTS